jgi:hypothetical protein
MTDSRVEGGGNLRLGNLGWSGPQHVSAHDLR